MHGKRRLLATLSARTGITRLLEAFPIKPSLLILNYHRIGDAHLTPYDSGTFSATTAEFNWQVAHVKRHYRIIGLPEAVEIIQGRLIPTEPVVLITFDDGYLDNFQEAFPVLRNHGVSGTFFLPTAFVGTDHLPWWDTIAFLVKNSDQQRITLSYPHRAEFDLSPPNRRSSIIGLLRLFKTPAVSETERFLRELQAACRSPRPDTAAERCFLNWEEAREMQATGMYFGSHTHTHPILSKLPLKAQVNELATSRSIIEHELGRTTDTLAYPVGQQDSFSLETHKALKQTGYSAAFSFYSGINMPGAIAPYNVLRGSVEDDVTRPLFRLRLTLRAATHKELI